MPEMEGVGSGDESGVCGREDVESNELGDFAWGSDISWSRFLSLDEISGWALSTESMPLKFDPGNGIEKSEIIEEILLENGIGAVFAVVEFVLFNCSCEFNSKPVAIGISIKLLCKFLEKNLKKYFKNQKLLFKICFLTKKFSSFYGKNWK